MPKKNLNEHDVNELEDAAEQDVKDSAGPDLPEQIVKVGRFTLMDYYVLVAASLVPLCRGADNLWRPVGRPDVAFPPCPIEYLLGEGVLRPVMLRDFGSGGRRHQHEALDDLEQADIVETSAAGRRLLSILSDVACKLAARWSDIRPTGGLSSTALH